MFAAPKVETKKWTDNYCCLLFYVDSAHRGPVTGCVFSKACNFLVTVGTDCDGKILARQFSFFIFHTEHVSGK